jgi:hypothetical protein
MRIRAHGLTVKLLGLVVHVRHDECQLVAIQTEQNKGNTLTNLYVQGTTTASCWLLMMLNVGVLRVLPGCSLFAVVWTDGLFFATPPSVLIRSTGANSVFP